MPNVPSPPTGHRPALGLAGERHARDHLERLGMTILEQRFRTRHGEIDIVAHDRRALVFCEVKARRARRGDAPDRTSPWISLHAGKQARVRRLATAWLAEHPDRPRTPDLRFDAIGVWIDGDGRLVRLEHVEAAF
ncbi:MAG: YraN family protein [Solirubrobacteraceae bacterium]|nr:YraN family protein [Solirubrobacteraceae bacterium]